MHAEVDINKTKSLKSRDKCELRLKGIQFDC